MNFSALIALTAIFTVLPMTASAPLVIKLIDEDQQPLKRQQFELVDQAGHIMSFKTLDDGMFIMQQPTDNYAIINDDTEVALTTDINEIQFHPEETTEVEDASADESPALQVTIHALLSDLTVASNMPLQLLKDNEVIDEVITDDSGTASFHNVEAGSYTISYNHQTVAVEAGEEKYFIMTTDDSAEPQSITTDEQPVQRAVQQHSNDIRRNSNKVQQRDRVSAILSDQPEDRQTKSTARPQLPVTKEKPAKTNSQESKVTQQLPATQPVTKEKLAKTESKVTRQLPVDPPSIKPYSPVPRDDNNQPNNHAATNDSSTTHDTMTDDKTHEVPEYSANSTPVTSKTSSRPADNTQQTSHESLPATGEQPMALNLTGYILLLMGTLLLLQPRLNKRNSR